jgi:hypothetical protein
MKKVILAAGVFVSAFMITSCGPSQKDAIKFNDELIAIQKSLMPVHEGFIDQLDGHNLDSLKIMNTVFMERTKTALEACEKLQPINEKREYLDAALEYFKTMNTLSLNEGKMMAELMMKDSTQITEADIAKYDEYAGKFDSEYNRVFGKIQQAQEAFAKEWKFQLIEK